MALAVLPVLMLGAQGGDHADRIGKQFAAKNPGVTIETHTLEEHLTERQEIDRAQLIIEGTVLEAKPYWKIIGYDSFPRIYTEYAVKVNDVIKGDGGLSYKTVKVVMEGGTLDGITATTEAIELTEGTKTILLLAKERHTIYGEAYFPISVSKSTYKIENDQAINKVDDRSGNKDEVKERIGLIHSQGSNMRTLLTTGGLLDIRAPGDCSDVENHIWPLADEAFSPRASECRAQECGTLRPVNVDGEC